MSPGLVGDTLSELVLLIVCAFLFLYTLRSRPGVAFACAGLGLTSALGVARYLGVTQIAGPHRFFILLSSCAALPLLADALSFPDGEPARTRRGASLFLFMASLVAIALVVGLRFELWTHLVPGLATLFILVMALRARRVQVAIGALILIATFALLLARMTPPPLTTAQLLHYGMAGALLVMCVKFRG